MSEITVGVAFTPQEWRAAFQRYVRDHVVGVVPRIVRDSRMALEEHVDVLVVDDDAGFLSAAFVAAVRQLGVQIVGIYDPDEIDDAGRAHLQRLGVDVTLPSTTAPEELLAHLRRLVAESGVSRRFEDVVAGLELDTGPQPATGRLLAVGGPPGAGATEVAVALTQVLARRSRAILVDVDEVNPGVARRLHLAVHPHLLTAVDGLQGTALDPLALDPGRDPVEAALARPTGTASAPPFDVIVGLADPRDWAVLRSEDLLALLNRLTSQWPIVVANLGPHLEDLTRWVDRYGASRATLGQSDGIVAVCEGSPRGVLRFLDWLVDASTLAPDRPVDVVVNRTPRSAFHRAELSDALHEHAGPRLATITFAPEDGRVTQAAWNGMLLSGGRFLRAIEQLATGLELHEAHSTYEAMT
jgi:MinD-like ATPase involved in chromosome partitioning or flagellar assembly